jgi:hypothetical protein
MLMNARRRRQGGQALVVLALVGIAVFGFGAIALDQGIGMADRRDLQSLTDSASLAASRSLSSGSSTANFVAMQYLATGTNQSVPGSCTVTTCPAGTYTLGAYTFTVADGSNYVDVDASHSNRSLLAGVLGFSTHVSGASARAQGQAAVQKCAICLLSKSGVSLNIESSGTGIQVPDPTGSGYGLQVDSTSCPANTFNGNSTRITAPSANFVGCALAASNYYLPGGSPFTPVNNAPTVPDPLGTVPEPAVCTTGCANYGGVHGTILSDSGTVTLSPGVYGELHPTGSNIVLQPGLYILTGEGSDPGFGILEDSSGTLLGTGGATLFFTCSSFKTGKYCGTAPDGARDPGVSDCTNSPASGAGIEMSSNGNVGITAPSSGTYQSMAIFLDRCNSATIHMTANGSQSITGAFYAKSAQVVLTSSASQVSVNGLFVAKSVDLQSNAGIKVNFDPTNAAEAVPGAFSSGSSSPARGLSR